MKLSEQSLSQLRGLVKQISSVELTDEEAQLAGIAILRFVALKQMRAEEPENNKKQKRVYDELVYNT